MSLAPSPNASDETSGACTCRFDRAANPARSSGRSELLRITGGGEHGRSEQRCESAKGSSVIEGLRVAVVIPCYRVAHELPRVLQGIPAGVERIIVVDDASPDDLHRVLTQQNDPRLVTLRHESNQGVGGATVTGMRYALRDGAQVVVKCDGDGQMDPQLIPALIRPISLGVADHAKGSRYHHRRALHSMPRWRLLGNLGLTFLMKLSSGYWNLLDPVNGFFATRADVLERLPLSQLSRRYFFESDLLIRLNVMEARVADIPQPARYGSEVSSLSVSRALFEFPPKLLAGLVRRVYHRYLVRDVSPVAVLGIAGLILAGVGFMFGMFHWLRNGAAGVSTPLGTIILAAIPQAMGLQLLLEAIVLDVANTPRPSAPTSARIPRVIGAADTRLLRDSDGGTPVSSESRRPDGEDERAPGLGLH
jgi:dolichol-phosphate mannosyltransferase